MVNERKRIARGLVAAAALFIAGNEANAADAVVAAPEAPQAAVPATLSPWQFRLRALSVLTNDKGSVDQIPGSGLSYSDSVVPELDITYYFTDNLAAELILGTTKANVDGDDAIGGLGKIGEVWVLPPTLTMQYHFTNFGAFKPYLGAGVNYTIFYNQDGAGALRDLDVKNSFGAALQVGFDYMLDEHWGLNFDVKKIFLKPDFDATLADGTKISGEAKLDPWLIGAGVTYRF
jgi:outer membrane protein